MSKDSTKSKSIYRMPGKLWKLLKKHLPKEPKLKNLVDRVSKIVMLLMAFGTFYGRVASGNRSKKNGSMFPVVFCMNDFRPGSARLV